MFENTFAATLMTESVIGQMNVTPVATKGVDPQTRCGWINHAVHGLPPSKNVYMQN